MSSPPPQCDQFEKRNKWKEQFKLKQEKTERKKASYFYPLPSSKQIKASAKRGKYAENLVLYAEGVLERKHGAEMVVKLTVIAEKQEVIKEKEEEIYGDSGYFTGFKAQTAQLNRICEALQLETGSSEDVVLDRIEMLVRYKMKMNDGILEDQPPKFVLRHHLEDDGTVLDVDGFRLDEIPDNINEHVKLTSIYASYNNIVTLPDSLCSLRNLVELDVSNNRLISVPEAIGGMTSISFLNLSINKLSSLPLSIVKLSNLTELNVSENQLSCLPDDIESLLNLNTLTIFGNDDLFVPESFFKRWTT